MLGDGTVTLVDVHRRMRGKPPIGYVTFPDELRTKVVARFPRVNFKEEIAQAFLGGFESKTQSTEGMCNEDIRAQCIPNRKRTIFASRSRMHRFRIRSGENSFENGRAYERRTRTQGICNNNRD